MKFLLPLLLGLPKIASASTAVYNLLAPLGPLGGAVTLSAYLNGMIMVVIGVAGVMAVVMIVICGIQIMGSPSVSQRSASKECIWNAVIGIVLAMGSWVLLNTINTDLLKTDTKLVGLPAPTAATLPEVQDEPMPTVPGWYYRYLGGAGKIKNSQRFDAQSSGACLAIVKNEQADPNGHTIVETPAGSGLYCFQVFGPPPGSPTPPPGSPPIAPPGDEAEKRKEVCGNTSCVISTPVGIKQQSCPPNIGNCAKAGYINLAGMPTPAIDAIKALASGSGQPVVITGGTESGHATHKPLSPIFDLRMTNEILNKWIRQQATQSAASFYPCRYRLTLAGNAYWFTAEGNHWHVCQLGQPYWFCTDNNRGNGGPTGGSPLPGGFSTLCPK